MKGRVKFNSSRILSFVFSTGKRYKDKILCSQGKSWLVTMIFLALCVKYFLSQRRKARKILTKDEQLITADHSLIQHHLVEIYSRFKVAYIDAVRIPIQQFIFFNLTKGVTEYDPAI